MDREHFFKILFDCMRHPSWGVNAVYRYSARKIQKKAMDARFAAYPDDLRAYRKEISGDYEYWIKSIESTYSYDDDFSYRPLISVLVPVYNVAEFMLRECIDSVLKQNYDNFELIMVDDKSTMPEVPRVLSEAEKTDPRIKVITHEENGGISKATNTALRAATGEFIALLDCDDTLAQNALYENVRLLNQNPNLDFIYSDEDKIDEEGKVRREPFFKPDFSPDTLLSYMYICHFSVYRRALVNEVGGFRSEFDGTQDYDLALRVTEKTDRVGHIPRILYHWRMRKESTAMDVSAKEYTINRGIRLKDNTLKRRDIKGHGEAIPGYPHSRVVYETVGEPLVSIVIPSKDHPNVLKVCLDSLYKYTDYKNIETIVIDNGSSPENKAEYESLCARHNCTYIHRPMDFNFSRMCNIGAREFANGEYILFLNDDTEILEGSWLSRMLGQAMQPHVGAVGAKLLFSDKKSIQHVGIINTIPGPGHMFSTLPDSEDYYFYKNRLDFDVVAVTAACLLVKKEKYEKVGCFDESFAVAYNDVDFCFKLLEAGLYNVQRNDAVLIHHESISRGNDLMDHAKTKRLFAERERLYAAHPTLDGHDPFYNPNLNQYMPDFNYNFDGTQNYTCTPDSGDYPDGDMSKLKFKIDRIALDFALHIFGWTLFPDMDEKPFDILLKGEDGWLRLNSKRVFREDICALYIKVPNSEFAGFKTMTKRDLIPEGRYQIYFLYNGYKYDTKETVEI